MSELTPEEIEEETKEDAILEAEIQKRLNAKRGVVQFVDPKPMNGFRSKPSKKDGTKLGRQMYERIKHKLHGGIQ
ncbi:hypothetical protein ACFSFY_02495 [Sporosarcina siberiensis]|uniref:Uncharacterized protein n=1 Tax=Sporosarcina siberiensis TaxID=1365606 RepID=A0ABW4SC44_9BACL